MCISDQRDISLLRHKRAKWIYILRLIKVDERYEPKNWISWNVLCNLKSICLLIGFFINLFFLVLCIYCPNYSWLVYVFALNTKTLWLLVLKNTIFISVFCALFISNSLNSQPAFYTEFYQKACSYNNHMTIKFWENSIWIR